MIDDKNNICRYNPRFNSINEPLEYERLYLDGNLQNRDERFFGIVNHRQPVYFTLYTGYLIKINIIDMVSSLFNIPRLNNTAPFTY